MAFFFASNIFATSAGTRGVERREHHDPFLDSPAGLPSARPCPVRLFARFVEIVRRPVLRVGRQLCMWTIFCHVRIPTERMQSLFLRHLDHRRRIGVLAQDVGALGDQRLGRLTFLAGVVPRVRPDHLGMYPGIHAARAQRESVDVAHHLGDGEGGDVTQGVGLAHAPGEHAQEVGRPRRTAPGSSPRWPPSCSPSHARNAPAETASPPSAWAPCTRRRC